MKITKHCSLRIASDSLMHGLTQLIHFIFGLITFSFIVLNAAPAQEYKITFFGLPAAKTTMKLDSNKVHFTTQSVGLIDFIWPTDNQYTVTYDSNHYGLLNFEKNVKQGTTKYKVTATYHPKDSTLQYEKITLKRVPEIQTIFTLLARVQKEPINAIDTKWFPMEHDGQLFKARFLWADTSSVYVLNKLYVCDHYRLDIKAVEDVTSLSKESDYFMDNIITSDAISQLWVENSGQHRIIQAEVRVYGVQVIARIQND